MDISNQSISEAPSGRPAPAGCMMVFGGVFFVVGLLTAYAALVSPLRNYWSAQSWSQQACVILSAELEEVRGDDGSTWKAAFEYGYQFDDHQYVGSQDNAFSSSGSRSNAQRRLEQLPVGTETICWVNPSRPQQALLDRSLDWFSALTGALVAIAFSGAGGGVAYLGWRQRTAKRKSVQQSAARPAQFGSTADSYPRSSLGASLTNSPTSSPTNSKTDTHRSSVSAGVKQTSNQLTADDLADQQAAIPQRLKPAHTKLARLVAVLLICCIWNGVVGLFLWVWFTDPPFGNMWGRLGLGLFLLPFVLIGLLLILGLIRTVLSLINPRVTIALSSGAVPLGEAMDVAWEVDGGWSRLNKLSVYIVGQEWARYVQGTDTRTDQSPFACIEVVSTAADDELRFGTRSVTIPAHCMHTFEQPNNKIEWMIRVHGHIRWWPNVEEDFPFRVTPPVERI